MPGDYVKQCRDHVTLYKRDNELYVIYPFTDELEDAAGACATLCILAKHGGVLNAASCDKHVQKLRWGSPEHLLQELQSRCDHIVIPVLRVV